MSDALAAEWAFYCWMATALLSIFVLVTVGP